MKNNNPKELTCRELYEDFTGWFKMSEVENDVELSMIFTYLQHRCSFANGNYVHVPGAKLREIIERRTGHKYILIGHKKRKPCLELTELSLTTMSERRTVKIQPT